ncbi:hypothetical protein COV18_02195 [Candidatus Woesearchaeota archaeon CG10_big_fil_rev_8_21_14_0_10_37_12]|nr:MAG: hypothetical protein COV18_02195 [Candidatus Woesearchaeota archaeon CG10_big_fil_rev_8_21_14_0_10_37_12]
MWIGHFNVWHENCIYLKNASKYNVVISMYPLSSYREGNYTYHTNVNILIGQENNIRTFVNEIKKDERCLKFSGEGNVFISHIKLKDSDHHTTNYYTPKVFLLKPVVHKDGKEDWLFGAWEKETITDLYKIFKKHFIVKLVSIEKSDFTDVFVPQVMPKLTNRQKEVLQLAIKDGYFDYPKRTDLEKLAKQMNISRVTFQEHLKKAQSKILPVLFGNR